MEVSMWSRKAISKVSIMLRGELDQSSVGAPGLVEDPARCISLALIPSRRGDAGNPKTEYQQILADTIDVQQNNTGRRGYSQKWNGEKKKELGILTSMSIITSMMGYREIRLATDQR